MVLSLLYDRHFVIAFAGSVRFSFCRLSTVCDFYLANCHSKFVRDFL